MPGDITMTTDELEDMLDRSAKRGAREALAELGLTGPEAAEDISDMRGFMSALRAARSTAWQTAVRFGTTALLGLIVAALVYGAKGPPK